ncbi:glycosyltransferase [Myxococcota bacterium]|nr:glycosyltransferase [Myxococcota bacterium]
MSHAHTPTNLSPRVAVVIATCDRPALLNARALTSLETQTLQPAYVVVVDDGDERDRGRTRNVVNDLRVRGAETVYLPNTRTRGASGAWNTGLEWLRRHGGEPSELFVAILDDDDRWAPDHLEVCLAEATAHGREMVISGIVRHAHATDLGHTHPIPSALDEERLLAGDAYIQGSNLFVRLDRVLMAGGFDEHLPSTTDRDLCLRLADLGVVAVGSTGRHTVHHYAEPARSRLSTPGGRAKHEGLARFSWKYSGRMTPSVRARFLERAATKFDWAPQAAMNVASSRATGLPGTAASLLHEPHARELVLVAGIIVDPGQCDRVRGLFGDLVELGASGAISSLDVVVLENGASDEDDAALASLVDEHRARGLSVFHASRTAQAHDATAGCFGEGFVRAAGRAPIGPARVMLGSYLLRVARKRPGAVAWILDEDFRLTNRARRGDEGAMRSTSAWMHALPELRSRGADIVLGTVTDAPPVPFSSAIRVQLVDAYHALRMLATLGPDEALPEGSEGNRALERTASDYYYDLSRRDTNLLEHPFALEPARAGETAAEAIARLVAQLPRIFAGEQIFRPLYLDLGADPVRDAVPSVQAGGNTFVFDLDALAELPHLVPRLQQRTLRRSDMTWAILNRYAGGRRVVRAPIPVRHDRTRDVPDGLDLERLVPDIQGYAVYSALDDLLQDRRRRRLHAGQGAQHRDALDFDAQDLAFALERSQKYLDERLAAFSSSFWRSMGLARAMRTFVERLPESSWLRAPERRAVIDGLLTFVAHLEQQFTRERLDDVTRMVRELDGAAVQRFFEGLPRAIEAHAQARRGTPATDAWITEQRAANALRVARTCGAGDELRVLGAGSEGVALTDGVSVYKVFDYPKSAFDAPQWDVLRSLVGRELASPSFHSIEELRTIAGRPVLRYRYEPSEPYRGGRGPDLVRLLREVRRLGLVFTNMHPKNLVVTAGGVRLVDYGADLRPLDDAGFRSMVQRTWLTMRCADRDDLAELMRRALRGEAVAELEGWERMLDAVHGTSTRAVLDATIEARIRALTPRRALDFGCGHGALARALARSGIDVAGYDPDRTNVRYWARATEPVRWLDDVTAIEAGAYDFVTSNLVLCVIEGDEELTRALAALRGALTPGGRLVLSVCNPAATFGPPTALQSRSLPPGASASATFTWQKHLPSGRVRRDVHRPLTHLLSALADAGLEVDALSTCGSVDLERFEPSDEILVLEARARDHAPRRRRSAGDGASGDPVVLCYHRVLAPSEGGPMAGFQRRRGTVVTPETFAHQMARLRARFVPIELATLVAGLRGEVELPRGACVVTFDDAYVDLETTALPILRAFDVPATVFAVKACARDAELAPVDELYLRLANAPQMDPTERDDLAFGARKRALLRATPDAQRALLSSLPPLPGEPGALSRALYLDEQALVRLRNAGLTLGSHATRHHLATTLVDEVLRASLGEAYRWVARLTAGSPPAIAFAYPSGAWDARTRAIVEHVGHSCAFTVEPRRVRASDDLFALPRIAVPDRPCAIDAIADGMEVKL